MFIHIIKSLTFNKIRFIKEFVGGKNLYFFTSPFYKRVFLFLWFLKKHTTPNWKGTNAFGCIIHKNVFFPSKWRNSCEWFLRIMVAEKSSFYDCWIRNNSNSKITLKPIKNLPDDSKITWVMLEIVNLSYKGCVKSSKYA